MDIIDFSQMQRFTQCDMETFLWKLFNIVTPLLDSVYASKEEAQTMADSIIPSLAQILVEYEIAIDIPVLDVFYASMLSKKNILEGKNYFTFMLIEGPDNDAKLALVARLLRKGGIIWQ